MEPEFNKETVRELLKEVLLEFPEKRKGVFYDVLVEVHPSRSQAPAWERNWAQSSAL